MFFCVILKLEELLKFWPKNEKGKEKGGIARA
jgi:hypothetical protein